MMLCAHPKIHLTHEASFYLWENGDSEPMSAYLRRYLDGMSFRWLRADPAPMLEGLSPVSPRRDFYTALMRTMAARYGKTRFGDKTPGHSAKLGRIFEDYPDARVVRIVRSPVAVVRSLNRMPWFPRSLVSGAVMVGQEEKQCAPFADRIHQIRLEDLLADPEAVLRGVLEFIGEPWDDAVLDHVNHAPEPNDMPPMPWFQRARGRAERSVPVAEDPTAVRLIEVLTRHARRSQGYAPLAVSAEPSLLALIWRYLTELPGFFWGAWVFLRALSSIASEGGTDSSVTRRRFRAINPSAWDAYPDFEMPRPPALPEDWDEALPRG